MKVETTKSTEAVKKQKTGLKNEKTGKMKKVEKKIVKADVSEIDDLFATAKNCKKEKEENEALEIENERVKEEERVKSVKRSKEVTNESALPHGVVKSQLPRIIISPEAAVERIDPESGYKVYKGHTLKVGMGGGTDLCPFDCDCCF
mmetsp:Transcript_35592/g.33752  ORF Transcript_35592/g.33752 Transcript_35592/m.33752 type:complete len:147 (-) Transcript_35592:285-725(-)|eukprot:CAMPEP_0119033664 /NCGR_PEP_ID=MMETSP1177-20130426/721_1 /TAXON_ID=2985 /ORGANISM="Ochromonas sp, Strain CCMP1899" /LENGTH=146 /DNA_ID=CAMNT_0006990583 /DNA_START=152 /DNA_END=592 /DNA_ORIENTATION=-